MNFASAYKNILNKIRTEKDPIKRKKGLVFLKENIKNNNILKHQFNILKEVTMAKDNIKNSKNLEKFLKRIQTKNLKFMFENNIKISDIIKEYNNLLEYYNINPNTIKKASYLDNAVDLSGKKLNEGAIISFVKSNPSSKVPQPNKKKETKNLIKESFKQIIETKSQKDLNKAFKIVRYFAKSLDNKNKQFIFESLSKLRTMQTSNFNATTNHLYKLRLTSEKLLREFQYDEDEGKKSPKHSPGKRVSLKDLKYIKKIIVEAPKNYKDPENIIVKFQIPLYPVGARYAELQDSAKILKQKLERFERNFTNLFIYQKQKDRLFNPKETNIEIIMRSAGIKLGLAVPARMVIYLTPLTGKGNTWETYYQAVYEILKDFNNFLPELFPDELTPEMQKLAIKADKEKVVKSGKNKGQMRQRAERKVRSKPQDDTKGWNKDRFVGY